MKLFLIVVEIISAFLLTIAVLMHSAKGEGLGGIGGQARLFGSQKDMEKGLNKFTAVVGIVFMITAGLLGVIFN